MAGILIASFLQAAGKQVVVLEANRIASGQTGNTTAKITSQHGAVYSRLIADLGVKRAQWYAAANQTAIGEYRRLITEREIDCDFEETSAYVYGAEAALLQKEAEAAKKLGLSAAFVRETALPFPTAGAVKFDRQAQFHPLKFLKAMAEDLTIYEHTAVSEVDGQTLHSEKGSLEAEKIIFACHFPFVNFPGAYFARMASGAFVCHRAGESAAVGRNVYWRRGTRLLVSKLRQVSPRGRGEAPHRGKRLRGTICAASPESGGVVPGEQGGGLLVGSGLHYSG